MPPLNPPVNNTALTQLPVLGINSLVVSVGPALMQITRHIHMLAVVCTRKDHALVRFTLIYLDHRIKIIILMLIKFCAFFLNQLKYSLIIRLQFSHNLKHMLLT